MTIYYDINSAPENLSVSLDQQYCENHGWQFEEVDVPSFDPLNNGLKIENGQVVSFDLPSVQKIEINPIVLNAKKYPSRRDAGQDYSDYMNSQLDLMTINHFSNEEMSQLKTAFSTDEEGVLELAKDEIDEAFDGVQTKLEQGKMKSAKRRILKVQPSTFVSQTLIDQVKNDVFQFVEVFY